MPGPDEGLEVVAGDPNVEFIILAKNDGYAVVVERSGWRVIQKIDAGSSSFWRPNSSLPRRRMQ